MTKPKLFTLSLEASVIFHYASILVLFVVGAADSTAAGAALGGVAAPDESPGALATSVVEGDFGVVVGLFSGANQPSPFN